MQVFLTTGGMLYMFDICLATGYTPFGYECSYGTYYQRYSCLLRRMHVFNGYIGEFHVE